MECTLFVKCFKLESLLKDYILLKDCSYINGRTLC